MKREAFLLFVILSFYIAGLYRHPPFLVLSTAALLSLLLLFFLPRYLKRRLLVEPVWTVRQRPVWSRTDCAENAGSR